MIKSVQTLIPRSRRLLRTTLQTSVLGVAALGLAGAAATAQTAAPSSEQPAQPAAVAQVEKIKTQLIEVDTRIRVAQQKALQAEAVKEKQDNYDRTLRTAMVKEEPQAKSLLEKQDDLVSQLNQSNELSKPAAQRSPEFQQRFQEYQKLKEELSPIAQRTSKKPEVAETYQAFQTALTSEVVKVEPAAPQLLEQRRELLSKYQQLVQSGR
jgi:hypothetical protein